MTGVLIFLWLRFQTTHPNTFPIQTMSEQRSQQCENRKKFQNTQNITYTFVKSKQKFKRVLK
jgi:hypothetical protein